MAVACKPQHRLLVTEPYGDLHVGMSPLLCGAVYGCNQGCGAALKSGVGGVMALSAVGGFPLSRLLSSSAAVSGALWPLCVADSL